MSNPTIAIIIDCSGSMVASGYLPYAKTDACTFVNIMQNNDSCSVIKFESTAAVVQSMLVLAGQPTKNNVCTLIQNIPGGNWTDMGDAIIAATAQIGSAPTPRGMVLLSDGVWNVGPNPMNNLPANIPIYTIALGNNGQLTLMQQIATQTSGQYNYAPGYRQLAQIYNNIISQSRVARTLTNDLDTVNTNYYREVPTIIAAGTTSGTFSVNWDNEAVSYTPNTPVGNQVNIVLIDPNGTTYSNPVYTQGACIVFNISNPIAGTWNVGCWYAGQSGGAALNCVWGTFVPTTAIGGLELTINSHAVDAGKPVSAKAHFTEDGKPMLHTRIAVKIDAPIEDHEAIHKKYKTELANIQPDPAIIKEGIPETQARIMMLEKHKGVELFTRKRYPHASVKSPDGTHHIIVDDTKVKGGYTIHVVATGISPSTNSMVQETKMLSFLSI